ncbi:SIS domain-containing protein [Acidobacteria bacterium ACD]|nr:SIS domain-containing protein [Acidobacteria bacterium ACD]
MRMLWKAHLSEMAASAAAAAEQAGESVEAAARLVADAVLSGRKVLAFGNGGSASVSAWDRPASSGFFDNWGWRN